MERESLTTRMKPRINGMVDGLLRHLPNGAQSKIAAFRAERFLDRHGLEELEVLPVSALKNVQRNALKYLIERRGDAPFGDYLEFGVFAGTSMRCMYQVMDELGLKAPRLFGFDSFEGMPDSARHEDEGTWEPGQFKLNIELTRAILKRRGVDMHRVELTKGWFSDTLTPSFRVQHNISKASVIMVDCDLYSSTVDVLRFCEPLIVDEVVFFFDDWNSNDLAAKNQGEKKAFTEFLAVHPELSVQEFGSYASHAQCFVVGRKV
jgi:O-methyltransferase